MTFLEQLEQTPPAARMVLPGAILALVKRKRHPVIWWVFGVFPMAAAVAQAISEGRLFGPKAPDIQTKIGPIEIVPSSSSGMSGGPWR